MTFVKDRLWCYGEKQKMLIFVHPRGYPERGYCIVLGVMFGGDDMTVSVRLFAYFRKTCFKTSRRTREIVTHSDMLGWRWWSFKVSKKLSIDSNVRAVIDSEVNCDLCHLSCEFQDRRLLKWQTSAKRANQARAMSQIIYTTHAIATHATPIHHHHRVAPHHHRVAASHRHRVAASHHHAIASIAKHLLQCALPFCCWKQRHDPNWHNWHNWRNCQVTAATKWLQRVKTMCRLCFTAFHFTFCFHIQYMFQCSPAFVLFLYLYLNLSQYASKSLNKPQHVSICLHMSQSALLSNFEQFWAVLSNFEQFWAILSWIGGASWNIFVDFGVAFWNIFNHFCGLLSCSGGRGTCQASLISILSSLTKALMLRRQIEML